VLGIVVACVTGAVGYGVGASRSDAPATPTVGSLAAGPIDIGFAQDMLDHHDQAIQIATFAQTHAVSPTVRSMASAVVGSQRYEIGVLEQFLRDRGSQRGDPHRQVMAWMNMTAPHDRMPGLQPDQVVVDYLNSNGADVDKQFLALMINHHEGGVHMADYAAAHAENTDLRALAGRMVVDQRTEIGDYQSALQSLG